MSPSPALANPSFLYGGAGGPGERRADGIVYATLDSLALKRATLPLAALRPGNDEQPKAVRILSPRSIPSALLACR